MKAIVTAIQKCKSTKKLVTMIFLFPEFSCDFYFSPISDCFRSKFPVVLDNCSYFLLFFQIVSIFDGSSMSHCFSSTISTFWSAHFLSNSCRFVCSVFLRVLIETILRCLCRQVLLFNLIGQRQN